MPTDTKKCNDRQENTLILGIIKGIIYRYNSCTCIVFFSVDKINISCLLMFGEKTQSLNRNLLTTHNQYKC